MPRIYRYGAQSSSGSTNPWVDRFVQAEVVVGGFLLAMGGFLLRSTGRYDVVIIGGVLMVLGIVRLWRRSDTSLTNETNEDRILMRLKTALDTNYTIALDYQLSSGTVDYLVFGPPGIFVIRCLQERGYVLGEPGDDQWLIWDEESDYEEDKDPDRTIPNPIRQNQQFITELRRELAGDLGIVSLVVTTYNRVTGPATELDQVTTVGKVTNRIKELERNEVRLGWEQIEDLERELSLRS